MSSILLLSIGSYVMGLVSFIFVEIKKKREVKKIFLNPYDEVTNHFVKLENLTSYQYSPKGHYKKKSGGFDSETKGTQQDDLDFDLREGVYSDSMSHDSSNSY